MAIGTWRRAEAGEKVNYASVVRIVTALGMDAEAADALAMGIDLYPTKVPTPDGDQGGATAAPEVIQIAAMAGELTPEQRAKVEAYMRGMLDS